MIKSKKILVDMKTNLIYGGTYHGTIIWREKIEYGTDVTECNWDFYPWEVDELSELDLEIKEVVWYFE